MMIWKNHFLKIGRFDFTDFSSKNIGQFTTGDLNFCDISQYVNMYGWECDLVVDIYFLSC
jgi:hypothetical protein